MQSRDGDTVLEKGGQLEWNGLERTHSLKTFSGKKHEGTSEAFGTLCTLTDVVGKVPWTHSASPTHFSCQFQLSRIFRPPTEHWVAQGTTLPTDNHSLKRWRVGQQGFELSRFCSSTHRLDAFRCRYVGIWLVNRQQEFGLSQSKAEYFTLSLQCF